MKTATRALILASLFGGAGCSGNADGDAPLPGGTTDPSSTVTGVAPTGTDVTPTGPGGTTSGPGVTPTGPGVTPTTPPTGGTGSTDTDVPTAPTTGTCLPGVPTTSQIPRLTNAQYNAAIVDLFGVEAPSGSWSADFDLDSNGEITSSKWGQYKGAADKIAEAVMATATGTELTTAAASKATLEASITTLGRKVMRRPLTAAEVTAFSSLADVEPAGTPAQIAEEVIYAMLVSPSFLMRTELDAPEETVVGTNQTAFKLSSHEVASRLSFMIWNSVPDQALSDAADNDELQTKEQIATQAQRMLGDEFKGKVAPVIAAAHRLYADIDATVSTSRWGKTTHDKTLFPEYADTQLAPSLEEIDRFFADVAYTGQFEDLFLSNVAYVNAATAPIYGLTGITGDELQRVELDGTERPGFLTRAGFLNSFSHEDRTSPILRGAFILRMMGAQTGAPNPDALKTPLPPGEYLTERAKIEALTSVAPDCVACHQTLINPPGFVMENFNAVGAIQTKDPLSGDIDTKVASVAFPAGPKPINNALELMTEIAAGRETKEIYARKLVSYGTGRDSNDYDQCTANVIADKLESGQYTNLASLLADVTQADSFRLRVAAQ
jgi:Protein of unknown function (DUF1592)/Protein of unknown function (DUF1588)/Protein of unknown function (DUF1595)/Protein of unknown function (DUF1585)/Protein of unknown function (DUF1587)